MKILILSNNLLHNGKEATEITIKDYTAELKKQGHTVHIIPEKSIFKTIQKASKIKKEHNLQFDIIHGFSAAPLLAIKVILTKLLVSRKAKTVQTLKSYSKHFLGSLHFSFILNFVDIVTVSTQEFKKKLKSKNVKVVHSHINTKKFIPLNKEELKEKYNYVGKKIIFYYGSFYRTKGVPELLQASQKIVQENPSTILLMCPRHAVDKGIQELVQSLNIQDKVFFVTESINIVEYLNLADVVVLPYISLIGTEGNPSCLIEAAACKIPIVTTDFPELREMFTPEKEVLMAKPGNILEVEQKIKETLQNHLPAQKRAEQAFKKIKKFDLQQVLPEFLSIYSS